MTSFLDKLKKGMDNKNASNINMPDTGPIPEEIPIDEKPIRKEPIEEEPVVEEPAEKEEPIEKEPVMEEPIEETPLEAPIEEPTIEEPEAPHIEKTSFSIPPPKENKIKKAPIIKKKVAGKPAPKKLKKIEIESTPIDPPKEKNKKWFEPEGQLVVDVYEANGDIVIQTAIAGVKANELDISIENDMVSIRGNREQLVEEDNKNYFYQECHWGHFSREIILPAEVNPGKAEAKMRDGVLTLRIPKIEREGLKKIDVKV